MNKLSRQFRALSVATLIIVWFFSGWPQIWNNPKLPPEVQKAYALNNLANPFFPTNASSWTTSQENSTDTCGAATTGTTNGMATFAFDGTDGNPSGSFKAVSGTGNNSRYKSHIRQSITLPGSGSVKIKGRFDYFATATTWRASNVDGHIKLKLYDSSNTTLLATLACVQLPGSNVSWTTLSFGSDYSGTGGTTYVVRAAISYRNSGTAAATIKIDNIIVTVAPTGLSASGPTNSKSATLTWATSTAGSGANGLHASTPYKVYRDTTPSVSTFLANATSVSYTDSSTAGNTTYYYAVSDVDTASLESPLSATSSILTKPDAPGTPTFSSVTASTLTASWSAPTGGASTYDVERCTGVGCSSGWTTISSAQAGTSFNDSGLTANTTYGYRIVGNNVTGAGAYSSIGYQATSAAVATISCSTDISSSAFGTLSSAAINTSSPNASTTISCSNTTSGCALYVKDAGSGASPGLYKSASPTALIQSANATLSAGTEGYGIQATSTASGSGGTLAFNTQYNKINNDVGGLNITNLTLASSSVDVTSREAVVTHKAAVGGSTLSGSYADTITYSCVAN